MKEGTNALIKYRLQRAKESLEEARILLEENKPGGAMNRVYYSMFYAASALLASKQLIAFKHSGVLALFHREFVKNGIFPKDLAKFIDIAFDYRTRSDYRDFVTPQKGKVSELFKHAKLFINKTREILKQIKR